MPVQKPPKYQTLVCRYLILFRAPQLISIYLSVQTTGSAHTIPTQFTDNAGTETTEISNIAGNNIIYYVIAGVVGGILCLVVVTKIILKRKRKTEGLKKVLEQHGNNI